MQPWNKAGKIIVRGCLSWITSSLIKVFSCFSSPFNYQSSPKNFLITSLISWGIFHFCHFTQDRIPVLLVFLFYFSNVAAVFCFVCVFNRNTSSFCEAEGFNLYLDTYKQIMEEFYGASSFQVYLVIIVLYNVKTCMGIKTNNNEFINLVPDL